MKYGKYTLGQTEAILNKIVKAGGGDKSVLDGILSDTVEITLKRVSYLVGKYNVLVNYDRSVSESLSSGRYDWKNEHITNANFPSKEIGTREVEFGIFHFDRVTSSESNIAEMKKAGFRPATMKELLSFGEKHPNLQLEFPIVALGSVAELSGSRRVGCLHGVGSERYVYLYFFVEGWSVRCRFLGVRI